MGSCRIKETNPDDLLSISQIFADKICSGFNQHAIVLIEGKTGSGKSNAALDLAWRTSVEFATRLGGVPKDYFSLENVAIISGEEVIRLAKNLKRYNIYILDDIGAEGLNARKWQSDINDVMTRILQTFRTKNNLLILTVPDRSFVDKIARNLMHYKIVMGEAWFRRGLSTGKLSSVKKMYQKDSGSNIYPFIKHKGIVYNTCVFQLPPAHIRNEYEEIRQRIEEDIRKKSIDEFQDNLEVVESKKKAAINKGKEAGKDWEDKAIKLKIENPAWGEKAIARLVNKPPSTVGYLFRKHNLTKQSLTATV